MSLNKHNISIACENCSYQGVSSDDPHSFFVRVRIEDESSGQSSYAMVECHVDQDTHDIRLIDLDEASGIDVERLRKALANVSASRVCGNKRICPAEIVRIVEQIQNGTGDA